MIAALAPPTPAALTERLVVAARQLGFVGVAIAPVEPMSRDAAALRAWLDTGSHGAMTYLATQGPRAEPRALLDSARSLIAVAWPHSRSAMPGPQSGLVGRVARYAQGRDYHNVMRDKLYRLADTAAEILARPVAARVCVDSAPLLERAAAGRAGLGFIAKNTMLIMPGVGSYVLLGELLCDVELEVGRELAPRCGACSACLDACPTRAFPAPWLLDARRCISYLTIEWRGVIPRELRPLIGTWIFGCDLCQEVCPFNAAPHAPPPAPEATPRPDLATPDLVRWLWLTSSDYRRLVRRTALRRVDRQQLQRNAAVALGNVASAEAIPVLVDAVRRHESNLVRLHAAWALGRYRVPAARAALVQVADDADPEVAAEARASMSES